MMKEKSTKTLAYSIKSRLCTFGVYVIFIARSLLFPDNGKLKNF